MHFSQVLLDAIKFKHVKKVFYKTAMNALDGSENEPALKPLETFCSILKSLLKNLDCTTKTKLIETVIQVW